MVARTTRTIKFLNPFFVALVATFFVAQSWAQNGDRLAEEEIKEQERIQKYKEYLQEREKAEKRLLDKPVTLEELENKNLVEVEPNNILPSDLVSTYTLVPYSIRRPRWGHLFSATVGFYHPVNYQSDFDLTDDTYDNMYGKAGTPYLELSYEYKWNIALGSIGGEISYGTYSNDATDPSLGDAHLNLQIIRLGGKYIADNLFYEPKIAPYVYGGAYSVIYKETQTAEASFNGSTEVAFYFGGGILFQLGWLDPAAAVDAYTESGIENTYVFVEMRQYLASSNATDPDFSTNLNTNLGLSLEF